MDVRWNFQVKRKCIIFDLHGGIQLVECLPERMEYKIIARVKY